MRPATRVQGRLLASGAGGKLALRGLRTGLLLAVSLWLIETVQTLAADPIAGFFRWQGRFAALALSGLCAASIGLVLVGFLAFSARSRSPVAGSDPTSVWTRIAAALWEEDPAAQGLRVAATLGALPVLALHLGTAFWVTKRIVIGMAQPHFAAIAIVAANVATGLLALALFPASRSLALLLTQPLVRVAGLGWPFRRVGRLLVFGLVVVTAAGVTVVAWFWQTFMFLPWRPVASVVGACLLALAWHALSRRFNAVVVCERVLGLALGLSAIAALIGLDQRREESGRALHETLGGALGQAGAVFLFDFDRDGQLSVFGGGDCAPFNSRISPVAIDIPNNKIDEDCDGVDLDSKRLGVEMRRDWPVPKAFPKHPTIVLLTIDAFAADRMHALGGKRLLTPNLDAFASRSTFFRSAFSQGPSTRLAFPSIFTSRWDSQIKQRLEGGHPYPIEDSEVMLAEALAAERYDTVAVVSDAYFSKRRWGTLTAGFKEVVESPIRGLGRGRHNSDRVTDAALSAYKRARKRPLFLWVHYYDAHSPHTQPPGIQTFGTTPADKYDAELKLVDREVGRLLAGIEATGGQAPLIFVTGDHGIAFDTPRHAKFNYGYDLSSIVLHVPLIVNGPQIRVQSTDELVSTMDIAPTLLNLVRSRRQFPFEGQSLVPELLDGVRTRPQRVLHEFYLPERLWDNDDPLEKISLRTDRYNLIYDRKRGSYELYDWRKDYKETHNLIDVPGHRAAQRGLRQQLALLTYRVYDRARASATPRVANAPVRVNGAGGMHD